MEGIIEVSGADSCPLRSYVYMCVRATVHTFTHAWVRLCVHVDHR